MFLKIRRNLAQQLAYANLLPTVPCTYTAMICMTNPNLPIPIPHHYGWDT